jgi:hypothetical protein
MNKKNYEFVPGLGSHYTGRIRSLVMKNQRRGKGKTVSREDEEPDENSPEEQYALSLRRQSPLPDSRNILDGQLDPFQALAKRPTQDENKMLIYCNFPPC